MKLAFELTGFGILASSGSMLSAAILPFLKQMRLPVYGATCRLMWMLVVSSFLSVDGKTPRRCLASCFASPPSGSQTNGRSGDARFGNSIP